MLAARPELAALAPVAHGALDFEELERWGLRADEVLDFSVNSNPFGPPPGVWQALSQVPLDRYPDREALALRRAVAEVTGIGPAQILAGNGTAELIWLVALAYVRPNDAVLVAGPTFGEYARAARLMGARVEGWTARPETGFAFDAAELGQKLAGGAYRLVFICTPNNPTGQVLPLEILADWARTHPQTLFVVDEAYLAFVPGAPSATSLRAANVLVLRSMTKDYALAGLRLGYAAGSELVIEALRQVRPAWSVNALAQAAGVAALQDRAFLESSLAQLRAAKQALVAGLVRLGYHPADSRTHYFLMPVGGGAEFRRALLRHGLLVRDCASFGLPGYVRVAPRRPEENARLLSGLEALSDLGRSA
jgi:L-threonine-O-3-phosphate decarboxylase